jgi:glycerophosphoryl diester phosphodiesterase
MEAGILADSIARRPLIIAHRGASFYAPENTLASARLAWQQDTDALEVDVHKTKDNHIVVIHDPDTLRTTGIKKIVREEKLATLQQLDAGSWKKPVYTDEYIPTLGEVIKTVPGDKKLCIEIKSADCVAYIRDIIYNSHLKPEQLVFMDFDINTVIEAKKVFTKSEILWLYEFIPALQENNALDTFNIIIDKALSVQADGINIELNPFIDHNLIRKVHDMGMTFYTWTVNEIQIARRLITWGIDGITTDRPGWMKKNLFKA